jgi:hypothetical protein
MTLIGNSPLVPQLKEKNNLSSQIVGGSNCYHQQHSHFRKSNKDGVAIEFPLTTVILSLDSPESGTAKTSPSVVIIIPDPPNDARQ